LVERAVDRHQDGLNVRSSLAVIGEAGLAHEHGRLDSTLRQVVIKDRL
jgi:hypothetical protein